MAVEAELELITIFTPTYNRAHILGRCYESLQKQKRKNFRWLIIDDGSTDGTGDIVAQWQKNNNDFAIEYYYKDNGGLHTAYNVAVEKTNTPLFVCFESDDIFTPEATSIIGKLWNLKLKEPNVVGLITLCKDMQGILIGKKYPEAIEKVKFLNHRSIAPGDKQYIFKTEMLKKIFPMKVYEGEKYFDPNFQFYRLDDLGDWGVSNEAFDIVDYQKEGLTNTIFKQYYNSPNSFADFRKLHLMLPNCSLAYRIKESIHYISSYYIAGRIKNAIKDAPHKGLAILAFIPGILFGQYIIYYNTKREKSE